MRDVYPVNILSLWFPYSILYATLYLISSESFNYEGTKPTDKHGRSLLPRYEPDALIGILHNSRDHVLVPGGGWQDHVNRPEFQLARNGM